MATNLGPVSKFHPKEPHFFKIILSAFSRDGKLEIPKRFAKEYGKNLPSFVFLMVPSGAAWRVELMKGNGEIWLQNGWSEFAAHCSIGEGYFLVFRYEGDSIFHVLVFDTSATEIKYPCKGAAPGEGPNLNGACHVPDVGRNERDVSVEILDDFPPSQMTAREKYVINISSSEETTFLKREPQMQETESGKIILDDFPLDQKAIKKTTSSYHLRAKKKRRADFIFETDKTRSAQASFHGFQSEGNQAPGMKCEELQADADPRYCSAQLRDARIFQAKQGTCPGSSEARVLQRAQAFKPKNPFFMVTMRPSYLRSNGSLSIPLWFGKKHFTPKQKNATLVVSDGRTWHASYSMGLTNVKLNSGWTAFARANFLKEGDVCVFELIDCIGNLLKVTAFRIKEDATCNFPH